MTELRGMAVVASLATVSEERIEQLKKQNIVPRLAVVRIGENEEDISYERGLLKRFLNAGALADVTVLPTDVSQKEVEETILTLNEKASVHGILVFRPLPKHLSEDRIKEIICKEKDVDCMGYQSMAHVFAADGQAFNPCTPQAVVELLDFYGIDVVGKKVTIVGRSLVVGKPLSMMLLAKHATVTVCHTKTKNLAEECKNADILIACAGVAKMITKEFVQKNQVVIDVGINLLDGKLCGDVDFEEVSTIAQAVTPVPGGVGAVTTSVLLKHTIESALKNRAE